MAQIRLKQPRELGNAVSPRNSEIFVDQPVADEPCKQFIIPAVQGFSVRLRPPERPADGRVALRQVGDPRPPKGRPLVGLASAAYCAPDLKDSCA
jgi:hypothetical protein